MAGFQLKIPRQITPALANNDPGGFAAGDIGGKAAYCRDASGKDALGSRIKRVSTASMALVQASDSIHRSGDPLNIGCEV